MIFNSIEFAVFFACAFFLYHMLSHKRQNVMLLAASYFFYGWWDWRFLGLIMVSTLVDYCTGRAMPGSAPRRKKLLVTISIVTNLGILGFFKYFNFFADSAVDLLTAMGFQAHRSTLMIILPVGISFYTFQSMAYTIDVYRGQIKPVRKLLTFATYVAYFPQLVAGPIERASRLVPQLEKPRRVTTEMLSSGALLVLIGLVRKVAIADVVAPLVERVFSDPASASTTGIVIALFLFSLQVYGDFAGYSDIARGISRMMGIELMQNFKHPYFACNITDFWRRWHVSLSSWLRDYVYIPLGGNRGGKFFQMRNLFLTMTIGGLWHGAAWTYVLWGMMHGAGLVAHRLWCDLRDGVWAEARKPPKWLRAGTAWTATAVFIALSWILFRAESLAVSGELVAGLTVWRDGYQPSFKAWIVPLLLVLAIDIPQFVSNKQEKMLDWPLVVRAIAFAGLVFALLASMQADEIPFIYFQF